MKHAVTFGTVLECLLESKVHVTAINYKNKPAINLEFQERREDIACLLIEEGRSIEIVDPWE